MIQQFMNWKESQAHTHSEYHGNNTWCKKVQTNESSCKICSYQNCVHWNIYGRTDTQGGSMRYSKNGGSGQGELLDDTWFHNDTNKSGITKRPWQKKKIIQGPSQKLHVVSNLVLAIWGFERMRERLRTIFRISYNASRRARFTVHPIWTR